MQEARSPGPDAPAGEDAEGALGPTVALLVVSLTIAAVGVYQLCGFGLHSLDRRPHLFSDGFATAGVIVATVAAGAAVGNLAWILTAPRRRAAAGGGRTDDGRVGERRTDDGRIGEPGADDGRAGGRGAGDADPGRDGPGGAAPGPGEAEPVHAPAE
ncbi:hypothetical protein ACF1A5_00215 [Streptomyces sp. NPDC014864]|uniref:hypothetical protein n=1 Tax=Streptomyces sp. NPDC014864 TaxID=3364924 RepID=UPI003703636B